MGVQFGETMVPTEGGCKYCTKFNSLDLCQIKEKGGLSRRRKRLYVEQWFVAGFGSGPRLYTGHQTRIQPVPTL